MAILSASLKPQRGEVYLVNFDPTFGAEIKKIRPAVIIQNDIANKHSPLVIVAAISSHNLEDSLYPTEVYLPKGYANLDANSAVLLGQVRTLDKRRLIKKIGNLNNETMQKVNNALLISFGLIEI